MNRDLFKTVVVIVTATAMLFLSGKNYQDNKATQTKINHMRDIIASQNDEPDSIRTQSFQVSGMQYTVFIDVMGSEVVVNTTLDSMKLVNMEGK